jgi:hypothetical protein
MRKIMDEDWDEDLDEEYEYDWNDWNYKPDLLFYHHSCKIEDIINIINDIEAFDDFGSWSWPPLEQLNEILSNISPDVDTIPVALRYIPKRNI